MEEEQRRSQSPFNCDWIVAAINHDKLVNAAKLRKRTFQNVTRHITIKMVVTTHDIVCENNVKTDSNNENQRQYKRPSVNWQR